MLELKWGQSLKLRQRWRPGLKSARYLEPIINFAEIWFLWFQKEVVREIPKVLKECLGFDGINSTLFISY